MATTSILPIVIIAAKARRTRSPTISSAMLVSRYSRPLLLQTIHAVLCVGWNGIGLWQKAHGQATIGPTASWIALLMSVVLVSALFALLRSRKELAYLALSLVAALLALVAVLGGFTKDPSLWPSEFWRWAGIVVNTIGVAAFPVALAAFRRGRSHVH